MKSLHSVSDLQIKRKICFINFNEMKFVIVLENQTPAKINPWRQSSKNMKINQDQC